MDSFNRYADVTRRIAKHYDTIPPAGKHRPAPTRGGGLRATPIANSHTAGEACEAMERLLASPNVEVLQPGRRYPQLLADAVREADAVGNLVFDAQIVALCRESGVRTLITEDRDFDRFRGFATERLPG